MMMIRSHSSPPPTLLILPLFLLLLLPAPSQSRCTKGCDLALASYYVTPHQNLTYISSLFGNSSRGFISKIVRYNNLTNKDSIHANTRLNIPFYCTCVDGHYLASNFNYTVRPGDTYTIMAQKNYANLTTIDWLEKVNKYPATNIPSGATIRPSVNCSCGDSRVSRKYGLFVTYPLRPGETLDSVAAKFQFPDKDMLQEYNRGVNFSAGSGIVFVPTKDLNGSFRPLGSSKAGIPAGAVAGITIAAVVLVVLAVFYYVVYRRKKEKRNKAETATSSSHEHHESSSPFVGVPVNKSVKFSYEELAKATNNFSMANKIGSGGFGDVYYAELRGERTAIKRMDVRSSKEFLAELKVLTHVHHLNLVRLIGYCTEESLFLVSEFIENGNLSEHLHGSGRQPLSWSSRMQIALDSARGLEYVHEHTVPAYIHRDIKSANILLDKNFHAKVADFGLAKLTEVGNTQTRLVGTFGYMPPEYARYGDVSAKVDVYAFGVVLYELISAKQAIFRTNSSGIDSKGLVSLFDEVFNEPGAEEKLRKIIDPRLGDNYPIGAVYKMAQLGNACTHDNPQHRPTMRSVVVRLITLSSNTGDWEAGPFDENDSLGSLVSGR